MTVDELPPHFHKFDRISEKDIVPDGDHVSVVPDWAAPEGTEVTYLNAGTFRRYKMIDGTWQEIGGSGGVGGNNQEIQYNDNGVLNGIPTAIYDNITKSIQLQGGDENTGGYVDIVGGSSPDHTVVNGGEVFTGGPGDGEVFISGGGFISTNGNGADVFLQGGQGVGSGKKYGSILISSKGRGFPTNSVFQGRFIHTDQLNSYIYRKAGWFETTDATSQTWRIETLADKSSFLVEAQISAGVHNGGNAAAYIRRALYKRNGGAPTLVGSIQDALTIEDDASWDATFVISSNDIQLQVIGVAATIIEWNFEILYMASKNGQIN